MNENPSQLGIPGSSAALSRLASRPKNIMGLTSVAVFAACGGLPQEQGASDGSTDAIVATDSLTDSSDQMSSDNGSIAIDLSGFSPDAPICPSVENDYDQDCIPNISLGTGQVEDICPETPGIKDRDGDEACDDGPTLDRDTADRLPKDDCVCPATILRDEDCAPYSNPFPFNVDGKTKSRTQAEARACPRPKPDMSVVDGIPSVDGASGDSLQQDSSAVQDAGVAADSSSIDLTIFDSSIVDAGVAVDNGYVDSHAQADIAEAGAVDGGMLTDGFQTDALNEDGGG